VACPVRATADAHGSAPVKVRRGTRALTVDIHCHVASQAADALARPHFTLDKEPTLAFANDLTRSINRTQIESVAPQLSDPLRRIADMDAMGIDIQAISPSPGQYYYWLEPDLGRDAARLSNDGIAEIVAAHPDRFVGIGTVPLQNTDMAVAELERCVRSLGLRGIEINSNVMGEELSSPRFARFFGKAEELDVLLFLHPLGFTEGKRLKNHYFNNVIGNPLESSIAVGHLIFDGVLDRHPGLKICVAHGGGYLPTYIGRMDHAHAARDDARTVIKRPPSSYLHQLYVDTVMFDPEQLAYVVSRFGSDHVLMGTDYPFDMAESDPVGFVSGAPRLSDDERANIFGLNAARLLKIDAKARQG
jgi:aminocarboxymuconate-semialdehyde decarboxylase